MYIQILGPYIHLFTSQKVRESQVVAALLHVCLDNIMISPEVQIILSKLILRMQLLCILVYLIPSLQITGGYVTCSETQPL
jgi:hypothetical protein